MERKLASGGFCVLKIQSNHDDKRLAVAGLLFFMPFVLAIGGLMHELNIEYRHLDKRSLSRDLADQIYDSSLRGNVTVVTERPITTLASIKKQWIKVIERLQVERARILQSNQAYDLDQKIIHMRRITFTAKAPYDILGSGVTFATVDDFLRFAPDCHTMYVTYGIPKDQLHLITSWMPKGGTVVIYA